MKKQKKHPEFIFRTVKNGQIKFDNRYWKTRGDVSHIEGKRLVFGTYAPNYKLLCLWGTPEFFNCKDPCDEEGRKLWNEVCEMMGIRCEGDGLQQRSGSYLMERDEDNWIAYRSRNIGWWEEDGNQ